MEGTRIIQEDRNRPAPLVVGEAAQSQCRSPECVRSLAMVLREMAREHGKGLPSGFHKVFGSYIA